MVWGATCVRMAVACACGAYGREVVEEVRGATEGESIVSGLFPEEFEEIDRLTGRDQDHTQCTTALCTALITRSSGVHSALSAQQILRT